MMGEVNPRLQWFEAADGARLRAGVWEPSGGPPRAICVLLNGLTEFIEKYDDVGGELAARGFVVASLDWRGQGANAHLLPDLRKAHISDFAQFESDLAAFLDRVVKPLGAAPRITLAHSMGAHILLRHLHDHPDGFASAVLCAPMIEVQTANYPLWLSRALTAAFNIAGPSGAFVWGAAARDPLIISFEENQVTSDIAHFAGAQEFLRAHPDMRICGPTFGWLEAAFRSMDVLQQPGYAEAITTPLLIFGAGRDQIVDTEAIRAFAKRLPNARYIELADAEHEILMESDAIRARFWKAFDEFVGKYLGP